MSDMSVNQILSQMSQMRAQAQSRLAEPNAVQQVAPQPASVEPVRPNGFTELLQQAVSGVNENQMAAQQLRTRFETGDRDVDLTDVMLASQKASIGFNATLQVRNRLVQAYQEIMNMPV